ncbi:MAG: glycosyltransferase, partial [Candidatus Adiutrix sp.]|nr:glycosyltransferase [Candidatus Adiutrix sp.]
FRRFPQRCDLVLATTGRLAETLGGYAGRPAYALETLPAPDLYYRLPPRPSEDGVFRFLYAASAFNYRHLTDIAAPAIVRIMEEYGPKVHFIFMGGDFQAGPPERRTILSGRLPYYQFVEKFAAVTADAALAPLDRSVFSLGKSDLKYREYGPRGLAGIYSDTPVYAQSVRHGLTGLLAADGEENWYAAMKRLIDHPAEARKMGQAARRELRGKCSLRAFADLWRDRIIGPTLAEGFSPAQIRPEERRRGQADLRRPAAFELARRRDQIWRRIRTFWYDAFYLDRKPAVLALKKIFRR